MKFILIHQYAGNKGDRAVATATVRLLLTLYPDCEITISTSDPELWADDEFMKANKVKFVPWAWDYVNTSSKSPWWKIADKFKPYTFTALREATLRSAAKPLLKALVNPQFLKALKKADAVISVGGHHFTTLLSTDLVSGINYDAMCVEASGKRLGCFSQSFGPFKFRKQSNSRITRKLLGNAQLYSREASSSKRLADFGIPPGNIHATYETVISLVDSLGEYRLPSHRPKKVGIAIYATQWDTADRRAKYIADFSEICRWLIAKGYEVVFFPMEIKGTPPDDRIMIKEITDKVGDPVHCTVIDRDMSTIEHINKVAECQMFIGHKTHSTIFALTSGTPLIGIAYHPKTREFMKQYGTDRYCIDDRDFNTEAICKKVILLENELDEVGLMQISRSQQMAQKISDDLHQLIKALTD